MGERCRRHRHQTVGPALAFLEDQDPDSAVPFRVVGAGSAGIEVVLALRRRWPGRPLQLQSRPGNWGLGAPQPGGSPSGADPNRPR